MLADDLAALVVHLRHPPGHNELDRQRLKRTRCAGGHPDTEEVTAASTDPATGT